MLKIICPNCEKENTFHSRGNIPSECSFCFTEFPTTSTFSETADSVSEITGLTIIYQITQQRLEISTLHKSILGRENFGASVFSEIFFNGKPVVSRKHCSIEFTNGKFYLLDEGSLNGTFYGVNKISCKNSPQVIEDKSIFYIGEEAFLTQINYKEQEQKADFKREAEHDENERVKSYKCKKCGTESNTFTIKCSRCGFKNTLIEVYV